MSFDKWLGLLFIGLRLSHQIEWSWWWVLAPIWGGLILHVLGEIKMPPKP